MPPISYYEQPFDSSRRTARLSDLAQMRANVRANATLQAGAANAAMVAGIGSAIGGTLADIANYKAQDAQRKKIEGKEQARIDTLKLTSGLDADKQGAELMAAGLPEDAARAEARAEHIADRADRKERTILADFHDRLKSAQTITGRAAVLSEAAASGKVPWAEVRPQLVDLAGQIDPKMADFIPQDDNPESIGQFVTAVQGMDAQYREAATKLAAFDKGLTRSKSVLEQAKLAGEVLAVLPAEQHEAVLGSFAQAGVPQAVLAAAPAAAVQIAADKAKKEAPKSGTFEAQVAQLEAAKGRKLNRREILLERAAWMDAGRKPEGPGGTETSQSQRAAAERWKQSALAKLEERIAEGGVEPDAEAAEKVRIQTSYLEQLGVSPNRPDAYKGIRRPGEPLNVAAPAPPAGGPAPPLGAAPASAAPAPPPAAAPPPPGAVPPAVQDALKKAAPGNYELSDGSTWRKLEDGSIVPGQ
jgi:hypothetical protein